MKNKTQNEVKTTNAPVMISVDKLQAFDGHPYKVLDDDSMNELTESIQDSGILQPLTVRPLEGTEDRYEIISGHRRFHVAQKAGLREVPAFIRPVSRDEAAIMLVDSNLHREHILPSEKAFAYKMKYEALRHQGTSCQVGTKSCTDEIIAENADDSARQIQRYIRLTNLIPELLELMDKGKIAFSVGVELSYLPPEIQQDLFEIIGREDCTPSYSQAYRMHKAFNDYVLTREGLAVVMSEEKPNQRDRIVLPRKAFDDVLPKGYSKEEAEKLAIEAIRFYSQYRQRKRERER